jgi:hypothetical protein
LLWWSICCGGRSVGQEERTEEGSWLVDREREPRRKPSV